MKVSDFRSDTVTQPTPAMREAMACAEVGDDVLDGDPTVGRLEKLAAELLGKEFAFFVPSGTMANQIAVGAWTSPGGEVILGRDAHIVCYEAGALGALHGVQCTTLQTERGVLDPRAVRDAVRPDYIHCPDTQLVCVEQTHMASSGSVVPIEDMRDLRAITREHDLPLHLDGARLFNAVAATGIPASEWGACADSVSICLSKGLGAPVGSLIAGDGDFILGASVLRKRLGGWMRQAGVIAAGGLYALEHNVERLSEDHALARKLAEELSGHAGMHCDADSVATNIAILEVDPQEAGRDAYELATKLSKHGVLALPLGARNLRFMTHMDVGEEDLARLKTAFEHVTEHRN